ncbi:cytochrome P450 [Actinoplanes rectilineatus]|uniref:cytochrome P450 n=1 Tax=Actinoplanes rectilineatus TaxID=113571 RepID=UPI0005F2C754|nr:cytochrome P450 [Actinoplanes rectilineatus]
MALPLQHQRRRLDPAPEFQDLQEHGPLHEYDAEPGMDGRRQWLVTGFDEVREILGDHERFSSMRPVEDEADRAKLPGILQAYDPPEHTRLRRTVAPAYSARRMARLLPRIEEIVEEGLDDFASRGAPADFVRHAAWPIPAVIACEFLGVPRDDQAELSRMIRDTRESRLPRQRVASGMAVVDYTHRLVAGKRREPGDGMLSALVQEHGDRVGDDELAGLAEASLTMATEQMAAQLSTAMLLLMTHPGQMALLGERPELIDGAIEEVLRFASVVEAPSPRVALTDVTVAGRLIRAGEVVTCSMLAINRVRGDRFDITREKTTHLAFGHGIHHCIGAPLVRLEMRVILPAVVRRFPSLRLAVPEEELRFKPGRPAPFAIEELPVEW